MKAMLQAHQIDDPHFAKDSLKFNNEFTTSDALRDKLKAPSKSILDEASPETRRYLPDNESDTYDTREILSYSTYKMKQMKYLGELEYLED